MKRILGMMNRTLETYVEIDIFDLWPKIDTLTES